MCWVFDDTGCILNEQGSHRLHDYIEGQQINTAIQKRVSGRSLDDFLEADFWGVSEVSFVRLQDLWASITSG